ncbi:nudix hydrolase 11-like isoform X2 [Prosopis cineraria]|uniref:nudix hydrolase 11-like isoform X2 n=1 Tax=Prosopis cineraria TaxID=364024 RepID=UPI00240F7EBC|nr:nudix hydrolase 11-like isoform X2 [Prosopis cineraria]
MGSNKTDPRISHRIQALLQHFRTSEPTGLNNSSSNQFRPTKTASVLICLFEGDDGNLRVFLTLRASSLSTHSGIVFPAVFCNSDNPEILGGFLSYVLPKRRALCVWLQLAGEVALPGGKREEGDANDVETALREAKEEIGLDPSLVTVITSLEPFSTKYGMTITPVIGILSNKDAFTPVLNPNEVEELFDVPLEMFLKDENRRAVEKEWMGKKHLVHFFDYEGDNKKYVIWAVTAAMLIRAASLIYQRPPAFLELRPGIWGGLTENDMLILQRSSKQ